MASTTLTHDANDSPATPAFPWPVLLGLSLGTFVTVTSETLPAGLMLELSAGLDVTASRIGLLVSVWAVTIAVTSLPLVRLTVRLRRRTLLWATLAVMAVATVGTASAPSFGPAIVSRVVAASAHGLFWSVVMAYAVSVVDRRLVGRAVSVVVGGATLAGVLGLPLGTAVGTYFGWRAAFALTAALMVLTGLLLARVLPPESAPARAGASTERWDGSAYRVLAVIVLGMLVVFGHFAIYTFVSAVVTQVGGFGADRLPILLLVFGIAGAAGLAPAGLVADRWPRSGVVCIALLFALGAAGLTLLGRSTVLSVALIALWGALFGIFVPLLQTRVLRGASDAFRSTAGALLVVGFNAVFAAGAFAGGRVLDAAGPGRLAPVFAAVIGVAAIALAVFTVQERRAGVRTP